MSDKRPKGYCTCWHSYWSHRVVITPGLGLHNECERIGCRCLDFRWMADTSADAPAVPPGYSLGI